MCVLLLSELSGWVIGLLYQSVLPISLVSNLLLDGSIWSFDHQGVFDHQGFLVHLGASHSIQVVLHASGSCVQRLVWFGLIFNAWALANLALATS